MNKQQIKAMIMDILGTADYDLAKSFDPETAEEPEYAEEKMQKLISLVEEHFNFVRFKKSLPDIKSNKSTTKNKKSLE